MTSPTRTAVGHTHTESVSSASSPLCLALVLMVEDGSLERTALRVLIRLGETVTFGRHDPSRPTKLGHFGPHRPSCTMPPPSPAGGLRGESISHEQFEATGREDGLWVKVRGSCKMLLNGQPFTEGLVRGDDVLTLVREAVLLCIWTPIELPKLRSDAPLHPFGEPNATGVPGESAATWELLRSVEYAAGLKEDVLVTGESGTGKSGVARGIHAGSVRRKGPIVKRSAKTFTKDFIESQLFGTAPGFVGSGKQSFDGLLPEAHGGTILFDEIGLAPDWLQEFLLSVLDDGVYSVVGSGRESKVDVRIIGTANQDVTKVLKGDFFPRFGFTVAVPPLRARRDDIGLVLRHWIHEADATATNGDLPSKRRVSPTFVEHLVRHPLPSNARQIRNMLLAALAQETPGHIKLPKAVKDDLPPSKPPSSVQAAPASRRAKPEPSSSPESRDAGSNDDAAFSREQVVGALEKAGWNVTLAATELDVSRAAMTRLVKKWALERPKT